MSYDLWLETPYTNSYAGNSNRVENEIDSTSEMILAELRTAHTRDDNDFESMTETVECYRLNVNTFHFEFDIDSDIAEDIHDRVEWELTKN